MVIREESEKNDGKRQLLTGIITWVVLAIICAGALFLRIYFPETKGSVIQNGVTYFKENDPWYHVRLVENLLRHFPFRITFDPYTYFPYGQPVFFAPLFDLVLGFVIMIVSFGHPTPEIIQQVSLYYPAVLGMLVLPLVYLIGKELFNRWAGLLAAFLVGIMPNTFLARSLMGFTDHHVAEVLLSTATFLFLTLAFKRGAEAGISDIDVRKRDWKKLRKTFLYTLLTGIFLGLYLLAWSGGLLLVFMLFVAFVLVYLIDYLRGKPVAYLVAEGALVFFVAFVVVAPFLGELAFANLIIVSLISGVLVLPALYLVSWLADKKGLSRFYYPFVLAGLGATGAAGLFLVDKPLFLDIMDKFRVFTPETGLLTISEARPLLYSRGPFSWQPAYDEYTTGLYLAPVAFIIVLWNAVKKPSAPAWLFIVWSVLMLAATLGQIRFSYYLTVNVALLTAYLLWKVSTLIYAFFDRILLKNFRRQQQRLALSERRVKRPVRGNKPVAAVPEIVSPAPKKPIWPSFVSYTVIAAVIVSLTVFPNYQPAIIVASSISGPSTDWYNALVWLGNNTAEPFGDPDFFYSNYENPANGTYPYPASAYGIMSWWDYGHWITEIGHRIPNANPFQAGAVDAANFLIAQDEETGKKMMDKLGSRYVIIDDQMAIPFRSAGDTIQRGKFYAFALWAGDVPENYFEVCYKLVNGTYQQEPVYYPAYYQSMCTRLYNFNCTAEPGQSPTVISFAEHPGGKEILTEQSFATYEDAKAELAKHTSGNWRIIGKDPFVSPVPLAALTRFQQVYHSENWAAKFGDNNVIAYQVEIYSYTP